MHRHYVRNSLNLASGTRAVICNGRIIGPFDDNEEFTNKDFSLLVQFSQNTYGDKLFKNLIKTNLLDDDDEYGEIIFDQAFTLPYES